MVGFSGVSKVSRVKDRIRVKFSFSGENLNRKMLGGELPQKCSLCPEDGAFFTTFTNVFVFAAVTNIFSTLLHGFSAITTYLRSVFTFDFAATKN